ncbi:hypothetical protein HMPREF0083_00307, partial [Aneurinibacillus aneurinilyticus ATCC 12856]
MVGRRGFGKKKRLDAPCAPAEERASVSFSAGSRPSFFSYLPPQ